MKIVLYAQRWKICNGNNNNMNSNYYKKHACCCELITFPSAYSAINNNKCAPTRTLAHTHTYNYAVRRIRNLSSEASQAYFWLHTHTHTYIVRVTWNRVVQRASERTNERRCANYRTSVAYAGWSWGWGWCVAAPTRQTLSMQFCTHSRISIKNKSQNVAHNKGWWSRWDFELL